MKIKFNTKEEKDAFMDDFSKYGRILALGLVDLANSYGGRCYSDYYYDLTTTDPSDFYQSDFEVCVNNPKLAGIDYPVKDYKVNFNSSKAKSRAEILDEVKEIICHDRNDQYGGPEQSFEVIGAFFSTYLRYKKGIAIDISGEDVAMMMTLFKIGRHCSGKEKLDNWLDAIGYLACGAELAACVKEERDASSDYMNSLCMDCPYLYYEGSKEDDDNVL